MPFVPAACLGGKALSRESALLVLRDVGRSQTFVLLGIQYFDGVLCIWFCAFGKLQFHRKWTIHLHSKIKALNMFQVHRLLPTCHAIPIAGHQRCHVGPDILKRKKNNSQHNITYFIEIQEHVCNDGECSV